MRIKFKTIPGEQFVIRREVFRRVQELFAEAGIEFAHRNVTVYLPPDEKKTDAEAEAQGQADAERQRRLLEAGAAGAAAIQAAEDEQKARQGNQKE
jgi:small-conductance mechanosensitive channel